MECWTGAVASGDGAGGFVFGRNGVRMGDLNGLWTAPLSLRRLRGCGVSIESRLDLQNVP